MIIYKTMGEAVNTRMDKRYYQLYAEGVPVIVVNVWESFDAGIACDYREYKTIRL